MNKLSTGKYLMIAAIFTIAAFQGYWLHKLFNEEYSNIQKQADVLLKQTVQQLQESTIKTDSNFIHYLSNHAAKENYAITFDTAKQTVKVVSPKFKERKITTQSVKGDSSLNYVTIQSSKYLTNEIADSILNKMNTSNIRRVDFTKDSLGKRKGIIILNSALGFTKDSFVSKGFKMNSKDPSHNSKIAATIKLDSTTISKHLLGNLNATKFKKIAGSDSTKFNFSNLVIKIINDSIAPEKVDSLFKQSLAKEKIVLPYKLISKRVPKDSIPIIDTTKKSLHTSPITIGLVNPLAYQAQFVNPFWLIIKRLSLPISISFLLLSFVTLAFVFLYKNMLSQRKLANMKSDFISNVTHELKTPIATVNVAIEALRNFNALDDKKKSQDYLDISAMEINRLGLLVDNVLKLSMFENDKIELKKENFDIVALTQEVVTALSIQIDKKQANVDVEANLANIFIEADKLHLTSILFNLLDNALKYSSEKPQILLKLHKENNQLIISVADNGFGISKEHQQKIFDKFYRVNTGDRHNVKGYGLGLSYVSYIVKKHLGTITLKSELNKGSEFIIALPLTN